MNKLEKVSRLQPNEVLGRVSSRLCILQRQDIQVTRFCSRYIYISVFFEEMNIDPKNPKEAGWRPF